jgi:hypothetical protein
MTDTAVSFSLPLVAALLSAASARARKRGLAFSLTASDVERMWVAKQRVLRR